MKKPLKDYAIIDLHVHIFPEKIALAAAESIRDYYALPLEGDGTLATYQAMCRDLRVVKTVISSAATKAENVPSAIDFIDQKTQRNPSLIGFGTTHADYTENEREFERMAERNLKGIKLHCDFQRFEIDTPKMDSAYRLAQRYRLPILFHVGDENTDYTTPKRLRNVMERFPDLTVIAAHMGGYRQKAESEQYLVGTRAYFDTSEWHNMMTKEELYDMICRHGADKVLYGCDYPMNSPYTAARALYDAIPDGALLERVYYDNARRLLGL